ncbi:MAG: hypothetical protein NVS3B10_17500 [Polyangiales bacterium]
MNLRHATHPRAAFAVVTLVLIALPGCAHPQKRNDWRQPAPPMACTSDADCRGGTCSIELGGSKGTCVAAAGAPGTLGDGGAPNPAQSPGPNVQPSSSDIQL